MKQKAKSIIVELRSGRLQLETEASPIPLHRLLGFASRINSKRGFLLISKILGKHYPVKPRKMAWSYRALAKQIMNHLDSSQTALWVGMAETATGLGYGIYEAAYHLGAQKSLYIQTTRYFLSDIERIEFVETHSHATDFCLYFPENPDNRTTFLNAEQLILIDDEISTGLTFSRLVAAYRAVNPGLKSVIIASLVNFASAQHRSQVEIEAGIPVKWVYFIEGRWQFEPIAAEQNQFIDNTINVVGNGECKKNILAWPGRLGIDRPITVSEKTIQAFLQFLPKQSDNRPILVLGTGECNPPAYLLGRYLEQLNLPVIVQATTRSPIFVGGDIETRIKFRDNYQDNIHNFLYNINPDNFRLTVFCHETPLLASNNQNEMDFIGLIKHFNAISAQFSSLGEQNAEFIFCRP